MRAAFHILIPLALIGALAGCSTGVSNKGLFANGLFAKRGAQTADHSAGISATATPLDTTVIGTQTLAPVVPGQVIGQEIGADTTTPNTAIAAPKAASQSTTESAAQIGAAAAAALKAGAKATTPGGAAPPVSAPSDAASSDAAKAAQPKAAPPKSPEEAACINSGGRWGRAGNTSAMSCFRPSKDSGKSCSKQSDCTSQCLARSRSCAPFWPIFGCTEVIQNNGAVVKLCLE